MLIGVVKEVRSGENRVALTPDVVKQLKKAGFDVVMESGAGMASGFCDISYQESGATIDNKNGILTSTDVLLKVNTPIHEEVNGLKEGAVIISFLYAYTQPSLIDALVARKISAFAMDAVPRISRAQKMDALSSQSNLAGYKAVLLGANALKKIFPLMMTAAGTITPAKVLIFGAGVAGLSFFSVIWRILLLWVVRDLAFVLVVAFYRLRRPLLDGRIIRPRPFLLFSVSHSLAAPQSFLGGV